LATKETVVAKATASALFGEDEDDDDSGEFWKVNKKKEAKEVEEEQKGDELQEDLDL